MTVEFAFCLIAFLLLIGGLIDFGSAFYAKQEVINVSRAGARYGATQVDANGNHPTQGDIQQWVQNYYGADFRVSVSYPPATPPAITVLATKNLNWPFLGSFGGMFALPAEVKGATTMTLE